MASIDFQGKSFEIDEDGFLLKFEEWSPEWMEYVKESDGIAEILHGFIKVFLDSGV